MLVSGWLRAFFSSVLPHPRSFRMHCHLSPQLHVSLQLPACSRRRCRVITALFGRRAPIIEPSSTCGDARQALVECAVCCQRMLRPERRASLWRSLETRGGHTQYQHLRTPAGRVRVHGGLPRGGCCCYYESTPPAVRPLCNGETAMRLAVATWTAEKSLARLTRHRSLRSSVPLQFTCIFERARCVPPAWLECCPAADDTAPTRRRDCQEER